MQLTFENILMRLTFRLMLTGFFRGAVSQKFIEVTCGRLLQNINDYTRWLILIENGRL